MCSAVQAHDSHHVHSSCVARFVLAALRLTCLQHQVVIFIIIEILILVYCVCKRPKAKYVQLN